MSEAPSDIEAEDARFRAEVEATFRATFEHVVREVARPKRWVPASSAAVNALFGPSSSEHLTAVLLTNFRTMLRTLGEPEARRIVDRIVPCFKGAGRPGTAEQKAASLVRKALTRTIKHRPEAWRATMLALAYETHETLHMRAGLPFNVAEFARRVAANERGQFDWYDGSRSQASIRKQLALIWPGGLTRSNRKRRVSM